jgi:hypothetical protein
MSDQGVSEQRQHAASHKIAGNGMQQPNRALTVANIEVISE